MNPFVFDKEAPPELLIDRETLVETLVEIVQGGQNIRLTSPRRYGKTTLLKKVLHDLDLIGLRVVYVDLTRTVTIEETYARLDEAYRPLMSVSWRLRRWLARRLTVTAGVRAQLHAELKVSPQDQEALTQFRPLLNLPAHCFRRRPIRTVVVFDEFQDLLSLPVELDGVIRSVISHHHDEAAYIFAGSHPGLMSQLFTDVSRPFYQQARQVSLPPLPRDALYEHLDAVFRDGRRDVTAVLNQLVDFSRGHPQRAIYLAHFLWERLARDEVASGAHWEAAKEEALRAEMDGFVSTWDGLDHADQESLEALAVEEQPADETSTHRLIDAGHVVRDSVNYTLTIADPLFQAWILLRNSLRSIPSTLVPTALEARVPVSRDRALEILRLLKLDPAEWPPLPDGHSRRVNAAERVWAEVVDFARTLSVNEASARRGRLSEAKDVARRRALRALGMEIGRALEISEAEAHVLIRDSLDERGIGTDLPEDRLRRS